MCNYQGKIKMVNLYDLDIMTKWAYVSLAKPLIIKLINMIT